MSTSNATGELFFSPLQFALILISNRFLPSESHRFQFTCSWREGGLLVLPDGATRIDYRFPDTMLHYARRHVPGWYEHVNGTLGLRARNGDLYLVTGADKTSSWCLAAYSNASPESSQVLNFSSTDMETPASPVQFLWQSSGSIEARTCPVTGKNGNQCTFIRGFKLALNESVYKKCFMEHGNRFEVAAKCASISLTFVRRWLLFLSCWDRKSIVLDVSNGSLAVVERFPKLSEVTHIHISHNFCQLKIQFSSHIILWM
jgi:hypothetical protein